MSHLFRTGLGITLKNKSLKMKDMDNVVYSTNQGCVASNRMLREMPNIKGKKKYFGNRY